MEQVIRVTPVIGLPQFNGWSHVWDLTLDPQTKCVFCFAVSGENAGNIGRDIIENITQMPPRSAQGLYQTLEDCIQIATDQQGEVAIASGIFSFKRSIFATYNGSIILKRAQKVGRIIQSDIELQLIEGKFDTDDVFVFATNNARQFLPQIELNFQRGYDSDGVITAIVPALHSLADSSTAALAFIVITEEELSAQSFVPPALEIDIQATTQETTPVFSIQREASIDISNQDELDASRNQPYTDVQPLIKTPRPSAATLGRVIVVASNSIRLIGKGVTKGIFGIGQLSRMFSSKTYVGATQSKNFMRWLVIILLGLLLLGGTIWFIRNSLMKAEAAAQAATAPYREKLAEVVIAAETDPIPARETAATLIESIKTAQGEADASGHKKTAEELAKVLTETQIAYQAISGKDEVSELPLFYDLRLVTSDFISSSATSNKSLAFFIDDEKKEGIVLNIDTKQVHKADLQSIPTVKSIGIFGESDVVLLAGAMYSLPLTEGATPEEIKPEGDSNRAATLISSFASYVYVFNPEKRNIYRYVKEGDSYSDPVGWLLDPLGVPFDSVVSWSIDGDIWIGTEGGQVLRFASGRVEDFAILGLEEAFSSSIQVVTREELENVYVLEAAKNRVVVLTKTGQFLREVKSSSLGAATSLLVNQSGTKAYVVSGSTLFEIDV